MWRLMIFTGTLCGVLGTPIARAGATAAAGCAPRIVDGRVAGCRCVLGLVDHRACQAGDSARCDEIVSCWTDAETGPGRFTPAPSPALVEDAARGDRQAVSDTLAPLSAAARRSADVPLLFLAVTGRQPALLGDLLELGIDPDVVDWRGHTPLTWALSTQGERAEVVAVLLAHGADPNLRGPTGPPLVAAARRGDRATLRLLLDHGAEVGAWAASPGDTALAAAVRAGDAAAVALLLARGADPGGSDIEGRSLVDVAQEAGRDDIVALLSSAP